MQSINKYLLLIFTFCPFFVMAQYDFCPGEIEVCEKGWTEICFDEEIGSWFESIYLFPESSGGTFVFPVINDGNCIRFFVDFEEIIGFGVITEGTYFLSNISAPTLFCEGTFTTTNCYDFLIPPPNNGCGNIIIFKTEEGVIEQWTSGIYQVCKGDTLHFEVSPDNYPTTDEPNQPFTIDRLCLKNGYVINPEEYSFDIVWDTPGSDSLGLTTYYGPGFPSSITGMNIQVLDTTQLNILGQAANNWQQICVGENVYLTTDSENSQLKWEVSDGRGFSGLNVELPFNVPGVYTVTLFNDDECNCSVPDEYTIEVLAGEYIDIDCTGTTCTGNTHTYHSTSECDTYVWTVSGNGLVIDGGGSDDFFITVEWLSGDEGEVTLSTPGCFAVSCRETTTATIPLISNDLAISGSTNVCAGEITSYTIPNYQGTDIQWSLSGEGSIISGQGSNQINIRWKQNTQGGQSLIKVDVDNCALECSASATLNVSILNEFTINASDLKLCVDEIVWISTDPSVVVNWKITTPSANILTTSNSSDISETLTEVGIYYIEAINTSGTTCNNTAMTSVSVSETPMPPTQIDGSTIVCKEGGSIYTIPGLGTYDQVYWEVYDGSLADIRYTTTNRTLQYFWDTDGPYKLSASIIDGLTGCRSTSYEIEFLDSFYVMGTDTTCIYNQETYTLENYDGGDISWGISPYNAGTIIVEDGHSASILWQQSGKNTLTAYHCGLAYFMEVEVIDLEVPIMYPDSICKGELALVEVIAPASYSASMMDTKGNIVSNGLNNLVPKGEYSIVIYDQHGCEDYHEISIEEYAEFTLDIYASSSSICPPSTTVLSSSVSPSGSYTYQWFLDDVAIPSGLSDTYTASASGLYRLEATDENDCTVESDYINISVCCGGNSTGQPIDIVSIDIIEDDCYTRTFTVLPPFASTAFSWTIYNIDTQSTVVLSGMSITYTFTEAGRYRIIVNGNEGCTNVTSTVCGVTIDSEICEFGDIYISIPFVSDFNHVPICEGELLSFKDATSKITGLVGLNYSWDFDDPSSGTDNFSTQENPVHQYNVKGTYEVSFTVTDPITGCSSITTKEISVLGVPEVDFELDNLLCLGLETSVIAITTDPDLEYKWNFGDTISGRPNTFFGSQAQYGYVIDEEYMISLTATNIAGCETTITRSTRIRENPFWSGISVDGTSPLCPGETATFTAPNAGVDGTYLWSNNETTRSITVNSTGQYSVTATNSYGCVYSPDPKSIYYFDLGQSVISGTKRTADQEFITTTDSMTICKGAYFIMDVPHMSNAKYTWNVPGLEGEHIPFFPYFNSLGDGTYEYFVTIRDTITDCEGTVGPYVLTVLPKLENPIITSSSDSECANEDITLTVVDPIPGIKYLWSTGEVGESIVVNTPNLYYVQAISEGGCYRQSATKFIREGYAVRNWMSGCMETCFPMEVCISMFGNYTYDLYRNGVYESTLDNSMGTLMLTVPGDYEILSTSNKGCEAWTEPLSLSASPQDHDLNGTVYFDLNEDGMYDIGDSLLADVPVMLCNGNTVIDSTITDASGNYIFEGLAYVDLTAKIDISHFDQLLIGNLDSLLFYEDCDEEKEVNFPLISICNEFVKDTTLMLCIGGMVEIEGNQYTESQLDTITKDLVGDCDSVLLIKVVEVPDPDVNIVVTNTCIDDNSGSIVIENLVEGSATFAINNGTIMSDTLVAGLPIGDHTLTVYNQLGCPKEFSFSIVGFVPPLIDILIPELCYDQTSGDITILSDQSDSLSYTLDLAGGLTEDTIFTNVGIGNHSLFVLDSHGCGYVEEFEIAAQPISTVEIYANPSCPSDDNGSIYIEPTASNGALTYSLELNGIYVEDTEMSGLNTGLHTLYFQDASGCLFEKVFEILEYELPILSITATATCEGEQNGALDLLEVETGTQYRIDDGEILDELPMDLGVGTYMLHTLYPSGCIDSIQFEIEEFVDPDIDFVVTEACEDSDGGTLIISNVAPGVEFSLNGIDYSDETQFADINSGLYSLHILSADGCYSETPFEILEVPVPELIVSTTNTCPSYSEGIMEIDNPNNLDLLYSLDGENFTSENIFSNLSAASYDLIIENEQGCRYSQPFTILENPLPTATVTSSGSCENEASGEIFISQIGNGSSVVYDGDLVESDYVISELTSGIHVLKILDSLGCENDIEVEVPSHPILVVDFPEVGTDCIKSELTLVPEVRSSYGDVSYAWSDNTAAESITTASSGEYSVTISDDCQFVEYYWSLEFSLDVDEEMIFVPNIFSPNDDGTNDCFISVIHESIDLISYHQVVFDRWGNKMFETDNNEDCWDGMFDGSPVRPGVYVYITNVFADQCGENISLRKVGDVTVIR